MSSTNTVSDNLASSDYNTASKEEEWSECYRELLSLAGRKFGHIPPEFLAEHVMRVTADVDWPVRRAALEALQRRFAAVKGDGLKVAKRPRGGRVLGTYHTRSDWGLKPYLTVLSSTEPIRGHCTCPDYLTSSLGICKHLLTALEEVFANPAREKKVRREEARVAKLEFSYLYWNPVRPALGVGEWLERVIWNRPGVEPRGRGQRVIPALARYFEEREEGKFFIKNDFLHGVDNRLKTVNALLSFISSSNYEPPFADLFIDQALSLLLKEERSKLTVAKRDSLNGQHIKTSLRGLKRKLYPYQVEGVERFIAAERLLLADDMGLGKTIQAIASCYLLWNRKKIRRGLLIVPAALKSQWMREWQLFCDCPIQLVEGRPEERKELYQSTKSGFLIANYEQVLKDLAMMHEWQPQLIVLDEAQRIKNWATKTATYIKKLQPRWRLVLTGTPMENRLGELASIVEWVDSYALEPKWRLIPWHSHYTDGRSEIGGARNLNTIRERLAHCMLRRVREEVLSQLPPRTDTRIPVMWTSEQAEQHDSFSEPIIKLIAVSKKRPLTPKEFLRLMSYFLLQRVISNGMAQYQFEEFWPDLSKMKNPSVSFLESLHSPKLLELRELIEQVVISQSRKVVIFSQWTRMLNLAHWCIKPLLEEVGLKAVFFTGQEGQKRRTQNIIDFHDDDKVRVLMASDAGGVGLNLQRAASCCINMELPWNPAVLEQRIGRIYRLGQNQHVNIYNLVNELGIEARIASLVSSKRALFKGLFDGESNEVLYQENCGMMAQLEKLVEPVLVPELKIIQGSDQLDHFAEDEEGIDEESVEEAEITEAFSGPKEEQNAENDSSKLAKGEEEQGVSAKSKVGDGGSSLAGLQGIEIERSGEGELRIKAPPEAIGSLCALFESLAAQLREG